MENAVTMKKEIRNNFLFSLILSSLFSIFIIFVISTIQNFYFILVVPFLVFGFELFFKKKQDVFFSLLFTFLFVLLNYFFMFSPFILSSLMLFIPVYYFKDYTTQEIIEKLGFKGSFTRAVFYSVGLIVPLFILYILLALVAFYFGINDSQNVVNKVLDLPLYLMFYAVLVAPFVEEIFFRSFLVKFFMNKTKFLSLLNSEIIASFLSALLFSLAHFSYGSVFELFGTFFMGYALYVTYRVSGDIKVPIIIHMIINFVSLVAMHMVV